MTSFGSTEGGCGVTAVTSTAGATDDYSYSRHFVDRRQGKIIPLTVEWGRSHASTPFHPPYPEMRKVMREVSAGLLAVCLGARKRNGRAR